MTEQHSKISCYLHGVCNWDKRPRETMLESSLLSFTGQWDKGMQPLHRSISHCGFGKVCGWKGKPGMVLVASPTQQACFEPVCLRVY